LGSISSGVSLPSPFLSSVANAFEALAISSAEISRLWSASRASMSGITIGRKPSPPGRPSGPPSRGGCANADALPNATASEKKLKIFRMREAPLRGKVLEYGGKETRLSQVGSAEK
jgi:hypothetical protein